MPPMVVVGGQLKVTFFLPKSIWSLAIIAKLMKCTLHLLHASLEQPGLSLLLATFVHFVPMLML